MSSDYYLHPDKWENQRYLYANKCYYGLHIFNFGSLAFDNVTLSFIFSTIWHTEDD